MDKIELPEVVKAFSSPGFYPHPVKEIKLIQTQMSFLFLTGDYAYKIKKPVNLGYLDYTTLERRKHFCAQELKLNRRLSPEIYLEMVPVSQSGSKISFGTSGKIIEYAVKMKQLPSDRMMNALLQKNRVTAEMIAGLAQKLADFHKQADTSRGIGQFGELSIIQKNVQENFDQTKPYIDSGISHARYERIKKFTHDFIERNIELFSSRVKGGYIKDCHGDLHSAHICFTDDIYIYDCIEFNDRFRYGDTASEVAFLAMDIDYYGKPALSRRLVKDYLELSGDLQLPRLLNFYKCYRAYVRGKVGCFKLDDPLVPQAEKAEVLNSVIRYFKLAESYTQRKPMVLVMTGLVGTGKTTVARALSQNLGLEMLSSDIIRKDLADVPLTEHRFESYEGGIYSIEVTRIVYDEMLKRARQYLGRNLSVVLDASFKKMDERLKVKQLAEESGATFLIIECMLEGKTVKQRLEQRLKEDFVSDGRWEIYEIQKGDFDKVKEVSPVRHVKVDTSLPLAEAIKSVETRLLTYLS